jgi:hypothetical protein
MPQMKMLMVNVDCPSSSLSDRPGGRSSGECRGAVEATILAEHVGTAARTGRTLIL